MLRVMALFRGHTVAGSTRPVVARLFSTAVAATLVIAPLAAGERGSSPISGIEAAIDGERVRVDVTVDSESAELVAFRNIDPITSSTSLAEAVEVARLTPGQVYFFDDPPPGVPTYYAVLTAEMLNDGEPQFVEKANVTATALRLPIDRPFAGIGDPEDAARPVRTRPLPTLNPERSAITGERLPPPALPTPSRVPVDEETHAAIERLRSAAPADTDARPEPHILDTERRPEDLTAGVDHTMQQIVLTAFERERWREAGEHLEQLLSLPLTAEQNSRVYFYLGQAHFNLGNYRRAVMFMLQSSEELYSESRVWIEAALGRLATRR